MHTGARKRAGQAKKAPSHHKKVAKNEVRAEVFDEGIIDLDECATNDPCDGECGTGTIFGGNGGITLIGL